MWVQMQLSRGRREENPSEKEEPWMRQKEWSGEEESKDERSLGGVVQKCQGQQERKTSKGGRVSTGDLEPCVTLERETPFKEYKRVRQWEARLS